MIMYQETRKNITADHVCTYNWRIRRKIGRNYEAISFKYANYTYYDNFDDLHYDVFHFDDFHKEFQKCATAFFVVHTSRSTILQHILTF